MIPPSDEVRTIHNALESARAASARRGDEQHPGIAKTLARLRGDARGYFRLVLQRGPLPNSEIAKRFKLQQETLAGLARNVLAVLRKEL